MFFLRNNGFGLSVFPLRLGGSYSYRMRGILAIVEGPIFAIIFLTYWGSLPLCLDARSLSDEENYLGENTVGFGSSEKILMFLRERKLNAWRRNPDPIIIVFRYIAQDFFFNLWNMLFPNMVWRFKLFKVNASLHINYCMDLNWKCLSDLNLGLNWLFIAILSRISTR